METTNEPDPKKGRRPKSATRYPKRMATYVVAFAVQESHDDPAGHQQVHKKRSVNNTTPSIKSISPTGSICSAKTFTITPTEKLSHILDVPTISEVKIDIMDENQCGDIEKKSPQISNYIVVDSRMADEQPEIIFNATKHVKRCNDNSNKFRRKKPRKNKHVIKFKNVHFKYKNPKNNITRRLEKYYEKAKTNSSNPEQIQEQIYCNVLSKVVSRSRVLKKVLAKENLLDDSDRVSCYDGFSIYDDGSLNSSPSTTKKSFISYASQNTLIRKSSSSSRNEDFYSIKTANSVIQVASDITPYKTDVINVAVAVAFGASNPINPTSSNSNEMFLLKENLTSDEIFLQPHVELTSKTPSDDMPYLKINYDKLNPMNLNEDDESKGTLTYEKKSALGVPSDYDTFVIARTSSDFNKSSINSEITLLTSNSDTTIRPEKTKFNFLSPSDFIENNAAQRATLLDAVINLGYYPEMTPTTSSAANFEGDINDVIITDNIINNFSVNPKDKGDDDLAMDVKNNLSNILKKSFELENIACPQKNINLPNEKTIKAKLNEVEKEQRKTFFEEVRNKYPTDLSEMWDRLTLVLDLAVKRLEETLAEKIVKDLKTSLTLLNPHEYKVPTMGNQQSQTKPALVDKPVTTTVHTEVFALEGSVLVEADECIQCDLVQNQVIDQLMLKLSVEGPKPFPTSAVSLKKLKKPQIMKDYFEILKPPTVESAALEVGRGDTVTVSTATPELQTEEFDGFTRLKLFFHGPMAFIRENLFIITSVPTFFIVLFCLYGIIVLIMKPW